MTLSTLSEQIKPNLKEFNDFFNEQLSTKVALLDIILKYITSKKGKQIRPILVLLSARICGDINKRTYIAGTLVELLHTATLVHDDVVDEAKERRGIASLNTKWNNKIAVLIGDYLLSKGLLVSAENKEYKFLEVVSNSVKRIIEGELVSIDKTKRYDLDEDKYFKIISDKTASLISTCCQMGAISVSDDIEKHNALANYGEKIGIAFQLVDDIFDFTSTSSLIGKPVGNDLKEKKITLPLIYTLKKNPNEAKNIIRLIKKGNMKKSEIKSIIEFVIKSGGIEYTNNIAYNYINQAIDSLSIFPESDAKKSLIDFANFVIERKS